jgi:hypothetical protein
MTEAASGLSQYLSNDGWHAVDLWKETAACMIWLVSLLSGCQYNLIRFQEALEYRGSVQREEARCNDVEECFLVGQRLGLAKALVADGFCCMMYSEPPRSR